MIFRKIKNGLIEIENYFMPARMADLMGSFSGQFANNNLVLESGRVERLFPFQEFVIEIEEDYEPYEAADWVSFFVRGTGLPSGIREEYGADGGHRFWRLMVYETFLRGDKSSDGLTWEQIGGVTIEEEIKYQGFQVSGGQSFRLRDYRFYANPYLTVHNGNEGETLAIMRGAAAYKEAVFDSQGMARIFIDGQFDGVISIKDADGVVTFETEEMHLQYGDEFLCSDYDIDLIYREQTLDYREAKFYVNKDRMTLRNNSDNAYSNLTVIVNKPADNPDTITLSLDNKVFTEFVTIAQLEAGAAADFWVLQERGENSGRYGAFTLEIV